MVLLLALAALVALAASGCLSTSGQVATQPAPQTAAVDTQPAAPPQPAWRAIDRQALMASLGGGQVLKGNAANRRVALTFDCGSEGKYTPAILDALQAADVHVTFFVTGQFAHDFPAIVQRIAADGHETGNHSYSHPHFPQLAAAEVASQIARTDEAVVSLAGQSTKPWFRFPYGEGSNDLVKQVNALGYMGVLWTYDTVDWDPKTTVEAITTGVAKHAAPGAIILMHAGSPQEAQALPTVLKDLKAAGYQVVTVTEVVSK